METLPSERITMSEDIINKLQELADLEHDLSENTVFYQDKVDKCAAELRQAQLDLEAQYPELRTEIDDLKEEIIQATLLHGASVKGPGFTAKYRSAYDTTSYDAKAMKGYALVHPEIQALAKTSHIEAKASVVKQ